MADEKCPSKEKIKRFDLKSRSFDKLKRFRHSVIFILVIHIIAQNGSEAVCKSCDQGSCVNNTCVCFPDWRGRHCNECYGRISLSPGKEGVIHDGNGNYSEDMACSWLLDAGEEGMRIIIKINSLATECIWDHVYIHNGDSAFSPLMAAYSGSMGTRNLNPYLRFIMNGQYAFVHFYSDAAFTLTGFNISYSFDDCPIGCSENGVCNNTECQCKSGWSGENCDMAINDCPFNCSSNEECVQDNVKGYVCRGRRDTLQVENMPQLEFDQSGRASLALAVEDNYLWVIGGYRMGVLSEENNLFRFDLKSQTWERFIDSDGEKNNPWPRYGHTGVSYQNNLYLYGGVVNNEVKSDFWIFDPSIRLWREMDSGPRNISGHTAQIFQDKMMVIFGFSPDFGYTNDVLEYDFVSSKWQIVETTGSIVGGGYGHSSVYDEGTQKIYVYGGHRNNNNNGNYQLTDKLYEYDPVTRNWFILRSSGTARYLHSAVMMNGLMFVYGGNTHNDSRMGKETKCFSSDFMAYDRSCDRWYTVPLPHTDSHIDLDRFGQAMVSVENVSYMFGGFNAVVKKDLLKISPGDCSLKDTQSGCESAFPGMKCMWNGTNCQAAEVTTTCQDNQGDANALCSGYNHCDACQASSGCQWCAKKCLNKSLLADNNCSHETPNCSLESAKECSMFYTCSDCQNREQCMWYEGKCQNLKKGSEKVRCDENTCRERNSCSSCLNSRCMWCGSLNQCIDVNAYVVYYFYGQCMDWTTKKHMCEANACAKQQTCADCQARPQCGWCDDGSGTGTGLCHQGGMTGPLTTTDGELKKDSQVCPANRWFFNECPLCQCSGHSQCVNGTDKCEACQSHTSGSQCESCENGYFGNALNGGNCSACECNGQADSCHPETGDCYCKTRGVIGRNCERCDEDYKYPGDNGICYYTLATDYSYTFNLSKKEDRNYSQINFLNTPPSSDRDVDFTLNCSTPAYINITYRSKSLPNEQVFKSGFFCDYTRIRFDHKEYAFAGKENTTFLVYVYDFKIPIKVQISFSQFPKIDLVHFFVTFFSCFLSLLLIAAALWKIKHKYDSYRRRQQHNLEMEEMASRPFSTIGVEIEHKSQPPTVLDKRDHLDSVLRRRKRVANKPSAVAIEPLIDNKAAILTLIIQLPTGNTDFAPSGQSGLAMGSALVSIGSHRKQSLDHAKDKPKTRKHLNVPLDTCA